MAELDTDTLPDDLNPTPALADGPFAPEAELDGPPPRDRIDDFAAPPHQAIDPLGGGLMGARRSGHLFGMPGPIDDEPNVTVDLFGELTKQQIRQRIAILLQVLLEDRVPLARALRMIKSEAGTSLESLRELGKGEDGPDSGDGLGPAGALRDLFSAADRQSASQSRSAALRANADAADALSRMAARTDDPDLKARLEARLEPLLDTLIPLNETGTEQLMAPDTTPDDGE